MNNKIYATFFISCHGIGAWMLYRAFWDIHNSKGIPYTVHRQSTDGSMYTVYLSNCGKRPYYILDITKKCTTLNGKSFYTGFTDVIPPMNPHNAKDMEGALILLKISKPSTENLSNALWLQKLKEETKFDITLTYAHKPQGKYTPTWFYNTFYVKKIELDNLIV
jgi:hypothetical protein